jgi:hypothetical protein
MDAGLCVVTLVCLTFIARCACMADRGSAMHAEDVVALQRLLDDGEDGWAAGGSLGSGLR